MTAFCIRTAYRKTLTVLRVVDKLEARKMAEPSCSALNVYRCFTHEQYGEFINDLTERTASAGVTGAAPGRVELGEVKVVPSTPGASAAGR